MSANACPIYPVVPRYAWYAATEARPRGLPVACGSARTKPYQRKLVPCHA